MNKKDNPVQSLKFLIQMSSSVEKLKKHIEDINSIDIVLEILSYMEEENYSKDEISEITKEFFKLFFEREVENSREKLEYLFRKGDERSSPPKNPDEYFEDSLKILNSNYMNKKDKKDCLEDYNNFKNIIEKIKNNLSIINHKLSLHKNYDNYYESKEVKKIKKLLRKLIY
ncbi:MAG: hypothetical protein ACOCP8_05375 [archaeon]